MKVESPMDESEEQRFSDIIFIRCLIVKIAPLTSNCEKRIAIEYVECSPSLGLSIKRIDSIYSYSCRKVCAAWNSLWMTSRCFLLRDTNLTLNGFGQ